MSCGDAPWWRGQLLLDQMGGGASAAAARTEDRTPHGISDPVGTLLAELSDAQGVTCLLEDNAGHVVSHAVHSRESAPRLLVEAVMSRRSGSLHAALHDRRTSGLVPGGSVLGGRLDGTPGQRVSIVSVADVGHLWLIGDLDVSVAVLADAAGNVAEAVARTRGRATNEGLYDLLHDAEAVEPVPETWVAVVRPSEGLLDCTSFVSSVRKALALSEARLTVTPSAAYLVLTAALAPILPVEAVLAQFERREGRQLVSAIAPAAGGLAEARANAERALKARSQMGRCLTLDECRPYATHARLLELVKAEQLPQDPLDCLGEQLAKTLLAWLDHHGSLPAAARDLHVHPNTFRYRLLRAQQCVGDLHDPVIRLDLHLRLRAAWS